MPRIARVVLPGYPHHVTQRGNRRQQVFFSDADFAWYRRLVAQNCRAAATECLAYCLMPNHVHLVLKPSHERGLQHALADAHRRYTRRVNERFGWRGHLWQERFYSFPMQEAHLLTAIRYVEMNPVRAHFVQKAHDWPWSSTRAHLAGIDDELVRVRLMSTLVHDWVGYLADCGDTGDDEIRAHTRHGRPLGDSGFLQTAEAVSGRTLATRRPGRPSHDEKQVCRKK